MKNIRTRAVATAAVLGITVLSLAPFTAWARGGRGGHGPSPEQAVERLTRELDLSDDQKDKVQAIIEESFANRRELRARHREEMEALRGTAEEQFATVLTGDQMEELRELWEARQDRRHDCDRRGGGSGR